MEEEVGEGKKREVIEKEKEVKVIKGVFSDKTIDLLQTYYGNAIRSHVGDLEGMKRACWAVFYHSISTDDNPQHHCCPEGANSYQRAVALQQNVPPHSPKIPADFEPFIKPVFENLCNEQLLEKCLKGATQNQNESFNSLIWVRSPKTEYSSLATTQIAVSHATLVFNSGVRALVPVMKALGIHTGPLCSAYLFARDDYCIKRSQAKEAGVAKKRRKMKRLVEKGVEEAHIEEEGVSYETGGF